MDREPPSKQELLLALINQSNTVFNIKDLDGKYLYANDQTRAFFTEPESDYHGKTDFDFFPANIAKRFREADLEVINSQEKIVFEENVNTAEGIATHLSVKFPIFSEHQDVVATGMFTVDITQRKHREELQLSALQKYQNLITALGEITYEYDATRDRITWDGTYQEILGYTSQELPYHEQDWHHIIHPQDQAAVIDEYQRALNNDLIFDLEYRLCARDGRYLWFHDRGVMSIDEDNKVTHIIGVLRHTSEQKEQQYQQDTLQKELLQMQKMDALGQLTGGIAHDFNNILSSIKGYTELAVAQPKLRKVANVERYLQQVLIAGERASQLVQQMLSFSRGKTGTPKVITADSAIQETIRLLHTIIPASVSIQFNISQHHCHIKVDPINLQQALINLIINARDAIQEQSGIIEIILDEKIVSGRSCASCHEKLHQHMISIAINDNGHGIDSDEILNRMFDPFFTTKEDIRGSGIGLSVVHGIMHVCAGHILVNSTPGEGTCIELLFPQATEAPERPAILDKITLNTRAQIRYSDDKLVMIVDDEEPITNFLKDLMIQNGYQVVAFNNPLLALEAFESAPDDFSIVITDQTMPELNGDKLSRRLLATRPGLPIIMCSGYSDLINKEKAEDLGIAAYLDKPVSKDVLLANMTMLLRNIEH